MKAWRKRIVMAVMALAIALQGAPTAALAQAYAGQSEDETVVAEATSQVNRVRGNYWKLNVPKYWRSRVKISKNGGNVSLMAKSGACKNRAIVSIGEYNARTIKMFNRISKKVGTITLKNGKKLGLRAGDDGHYFVTIKMAKNKYVMISCINSQEVASYWPFSKAQCRAMAKLQSFGKKKSYTKGTTIPKICLQTVARNISKA